MKQQHLHFLGICGTFMGSLAMLAKDMGYKVTGADTGIYPPMSTFLQENGIEIIPNFDIDQLTPRPDLIIIGNAMKRGNPCVEYMLEHNLAFTSGPQWLHDHLLWNRKVLAVAGTHGKTTTTGMLSWILEKAGKAPGFLIGGISGNFGRSSRLGESDYFVIEADEYDTAFFDKRSKFVHYNPHVAIINNISFDHADIFENLGAIQRQFHHMIRLIPKNGLVLAQKDELSAQQTLAMGVWSRTQFLGKDQDWFAQPLSADYGHFEVFYKGEKAGEVKWDIVGEHNMHNALMAIAAARYVDVPVEVACDALASFINVKRRLEVKGNVNGVTVYDDFAHHPEAIHATLAALKGKVGNHRILAVLEPRSNTMKMGVHKDALAPSLAIADEVFIFQPDTIPWKVEEIAKQCKQPAVTCDNLDELAKKVAHAAKSGDQILIMSNGSFGGIHQKIIDLLK